MTADYETARVRLARMLGDLHLNTDDDGSVTLLYPMTVADYERGAQAVLGVITDGDLVALTEHRCNLAALRAEVERERADAEHAFMADRTDASAQIAQFCFALVLDLIDKHVRSAAMDELVQQTQEMGGYDPPAGP